MFQRTLSAQVLVLALITTGAGQTQSGSDTSSAAKKPSKGTVIGTFISDAISAAFPGVSTVLKAIWPSGNGNKNKNQADQATQDLKAKSIQGQKSLDKLSQDLTTITVFLSNSIVAGNNSTQIETLLLRPNPFADDSIQRSWNFVKPRLVKMGSAGPSIDALDDEYMRVVLRTIADANSGMVQNVDLDIQKKDASNLKTDISALNGQLAAANALAGEVISSVASGLKTTQTKAAGAQGSPKLPQSLSDANSDFAKVLADRYPKLR